MKNSVCSTLVVTTLVIIFLLFEPSKSAVMEVPEDVTRFENFLKEFEKGEIHMVPTAQLFRGKFPLSFEPVGPESSKREKRQVEPTEPGLTSNNAEDDVIRQYVRNEITRIFSCYQRLRCGYTRAQAEEECQWLEHSSLYHQLMKLLGIKNYPKKGSAAHNSYGHSHNNNPQAQGHSQHQQQHNNNNQQRRHALSDASMNPAHQNLQNGIRYGGARPGQYLSNGYTQPGRRAYDSFFTGQEVVAAPVPIQT